MAEPGGLRIHWAPRLPPALLQRLYDADARGLPDAELCDEVGIRLFERCRAYALASRHEVECPACGAIFEVGRQDSSRCPGANCAWETTAALYEQSLRNHYAYTGRAGEAYLEFFRRYPGARTYREKILLIDRLIHEFHRAETGKPTKSIASKLLEGNKKEVVRFLDGLSAVCPAEKEDWRRTVAATIDGHVLRPRQ